MSEKKVHNLEANSMEILIEEEPMIIDYNDEFLIFDMNARYKKSVRDVPNKRLKEKKK